MSFFFACSNSKETLQGPGAETKTENPRKPAGLFFSNPVVNFLGSKNRKVEISADTAFFSSGIISFNGNVAITPVSEKNVKIIHSDRGAIISPESGNNSFKLAPDTNFASGSKLELRGSVVATLVDGRLYSRSLFFKPKERRLWSDSRTIYSSRRGSIKSKKGFDFDSAKNTLRLLGKTEGVYDELAR